MAFLRFNHGLKATSLLYLASLAQAMPALGGFKYQGCYTDDTDNRSLTGKVVHDDKMTLQKCAAACRDYQWFGVESGTQCFCGASLASTAQKRPDTECNTKCRGSRCQICGDDNRLNVYAAKSTTTELPATSTTAVESTIETSTTETSTTETTTETTTEISTTGTSTTEPSETTTTSETETEIVTPTPEPTTSPTCELTTTYLPATTPCWVAPPSACSQLIQTPAVAWPAITAAATSCMKAFQVSSTVVPAVSACFTDMAAPTFDAEAGYRCVESLDSVFCPVATVCKEDAGLPEPTDALGGKGGLEDGQLWPFYSGSAPDEVIQTEVSTDMTHSGQYSLKTLFSSSNSGSRIYALSVSLDPGVEYEASWWWWSLSPSSLTTTRMEIVEGGVLSATFDGNTNSQPFLQWNRESFRFTTTTSFAEVRFGVVGVAQQYSNIFYVDDIKIVRVA